MDLLVLTLSTALLCYTPQVDVEDHNLRQTKQCWPVLVGKRTPVGTFSLRQRITSSPGYGGDVVQFYETHDEVFSIHRPWLLAPKEQRMKRLASPRATDRVITQGCINVQPNLYDFIVSRVNAAQVTLKVER